MSLVDRFRRRERFRFIFWLVILVAPVIAVVVLGFEICPFLRLLAAHVDLVLVGVARCSCARRPVETESLDASPLNCRASCSTGFGLHDPSGREDISI
jgi:hypothetical protein